MSDELHRVFNRTRLDGKKIDELVGIARGLTADGVINQREAEYLERWLTMNAANADNSVIRNLMHRVHDMLADRRLDKDESSALFDALKNFSGGDFKPGEMLKASTLPLDDPPPVIVFEGKRFAFTGTFALGSREECARAVERRGAAAGYLTKETDYLVVGIYATESWAYSSYGGKIEHAIELRKEGAPVKIVGERHWIQALHRNANV
jgi:NAD-dependent DNA ligase